MESKTGKSDDKMTTHPFSSDRPISFKKDDLLGVASFAESLASAIKGWKGKDSLVIALYGPWGSGKSSIKNIAIDALRAEKSDCPLIVEFNPWQWAGQEQLAQSFFHEIGVALKRTGKGDTDKKRAANWKRYAAYLKVGSFLAGSINKFIIGLLVLIGMVGIGGVISNLPWLNAVIVIVSCVALVFAGLLKWSSSFAEKIAALFDTRYEASMDGLFDVKKKLSASLAELRNPVVVAIDDVDRLSANEIKYLFQLVKANADFPNMVYLLLFQRDIVEKSLQDSPISGREFIEKIVQVGFNIPLMERSRMEKVLLGGLNDLLSDNVLGQRFEQQRWGNIFIAGVRHYFETLRDVHRFLSTLSFHISLFRNKGSFDVNPIDLIAIEVLRVFEPDLYKKLFEVKHILTEQRERSSSTENEHRQTIETIMQLVPETKRQYAQEIIKQLFPPAEWVFGGHGYGSGFDERWYRDLRVCHPNVFDRYFHFAIPEGDVSQAEIDKLLSITGNKGELLTELKSLNQRNLLVIALDRLEAYAEGITIEKAIPFITALMDIGDELPEEQPDFFSFTADKHIARIVYWHLKQEKDIRKRGAILKEALSLSEGLYLPIMRISLEESKYEKQDEQDSYLVDRDDFEELKKVCIEKIRKAGNSSVLNNHPKLLSILYHWLKWASPDEPKKWVEDLIQNGEGLLLFLTSLLHSSVSHSMGDHVSRTNWKISIKNVEDFVSPDMVAKQIMRLNVDKLSEKEQRAVNAFQKALKRRQEGKPDDEWGFDED
ncbi:MAG: hypothetical protein HZB31_01465 [Nitrospirae bacterium]|nr:hypothetical protein [Nitrospirota bacterium]